MANREMYLFLLRCLKSLYYTNSMTTPRAGQQLIENGAAYLPTAPRSSRDWRLRPSQGTAYSLTFTNILATLYMWTGGPGLESLLGISAPLIDVSKGCSTQMMNATRSARSCV